MKAGVPKLMHVDFSCDKVTRRINVSGSSIEA